MKKRNIVLIILLNVTIIIIALLFINKKYNEIPLDYIAIINGGCCEVTYSTYVYEEEGYYKYINTMNHTESWGSPNWIVKVTKKGKTSSIDELYEVAKKNNSNGYVTSNGQIYTLEEYKKILEEEK